MLKEINLVEERTLNYLALLEGLSAVAIAHSRYPEIIPLSTVLTLRRNASLYKKKWAL